MCLETSGLLSPSLPVVKGPSKHQLESRMMNPIGRTLQESSDLHTGMSMVFGKWIITPIKVDCKSHKEVINQRTN